MALPPPRQCRVFRGDREQTRSAARAVLLDHGPDEVLWVSCMAEPPFLPTTPRALRQHLGSGHPAVVLDLHDGPDADALGQAQGLVWAGGVLVLRLPVTWRGSEALAVHPYTRSEVGGRLGARFDRGLPSSSSQMPHPVAHPVLSGTPEQDVLVERLAARWAADRAVATVLLADRGRGKSAALGRALHRSGSLAVVTGPSEGAVAEVLRFAPGHRFRSLTSLIADPVEAAVVVVDEAAQVPVPMLRRLVEAYPRAQFAFATTMHGYEGTGRGFVLRFLQWLQEVRRVHREQLSVPIRWAVDDPLEVTIHGVLALDAAPAVVPSLGAVRAVAFDRDQLASDERLVRQLFGLLVHAHYRTTPSDLHRLLDAPNLAVHGLMSGTSVVGATLVAREGGLPAEICAELAAGTRRIRGHALPDTLISHAGHPEAGALPMIRSMRIATHPDHRRCGLGRQLVQHVHESYDPALYGTLFGATAELLRFRRSVGYELVRVGLSHGARTGEPSVVMIHPISERGAALVGTLRAELARDLPCQLALLEAEVPLEDAVRQALLEGLPEPASLPDSERDRLVRSYSHGPRPWDTVAYALNLYVGAHLQWLEGLPESDRVRIARRVAGRPWAEVAVGPESVNAAMRALRRAMRSLVDSVGG